MSTQNKRPLGSVRTIIVGVDEAPPPPMNFGLPGSPEFRGFEVDLLNAVGQRLGLEVQFKSALWDQLLTELATGRLDLICSAATVTEDRAREFNFSDPYLDMELVLIRRSGNKTDTDLRSTTIGVRRATVAESYQRTHWPENPVRRFDFNTDAYQALQTGEIDLVIDDSPIGMHFAATLIGIEVFRSFPDTAAQYALLLRKGNTTLLREVNTALRQIRSDGTWDMLSRRWFPHGSKLKE
jgi:polar amino acid transport system substrate-binding protein